MWFGRLTWCFVKTPVVVDPYEFIILRPLISLLRGWHGRTMEICGVKPRLNGDLIHAVVASHEFYRILSVRADTEEPIVIDRVDAIIPMLAVMRILETESV
jgi:hypothetical protein